MCLFRPLRALFDTRARTHALLEENRPRMAWECFLLPLWLPLVTGGTVFINYVDLSLFPVSVPLHLSTFCLFFPVQSRLGFSDTGALAKDYCGDGTLIMIYNNLLSTLTVSTKKSDFLAAGHILKEWNFTLCSPALTLRFLLTGLTALNMLEMHWNWHKAIQGVSRLSVSLVLFHPYSI